MRRLIAIAVVVLGVSGCASFPLPPPNTMGDPQNAQSYGYHPIDPLPVSIVSNTPGSATNAQILRAGRCQGRCRIY